MATHIKKLLDREVRMIGTCRFNFVDTWNTPLERKARSAIAGKMYQEVRGYW